MQEDQATGSALSDLKSSIKSRFSVLSEFKVSYFDIEVQETCEVFHDINEVPAGTKLIVASCKRPTCDALSIASTVSVGKVSLFVYFVCSLGVKGFCFGHLSFT